MKSNPRANRPAAAVPRGPAPRTAPRRAGFQQSRAYVEGIIAEMKRVTWPSRETWIGATLLTIALVIAIGVFTAGCDWIFAQLFQLVTGSAH